MKQGISSYDLFEYSLPEGTADSYARNAIKVLQEIKQDFPEFYDEFKFPSEVLTLSGVRAFDTYYALGNNADMSQVAELKKLLLKHDVVLILEKTPIFKEDGEEENRYSIIHKKAFEDIPNRYKNCFGWEFNGFDSFDKDSDFILWWQMWQRRIALRALRKNSDDSVNKKNIQVMKWMQKDWFTPHDISFGMLLGYPGPAIVSLVTPRRKEEKLLDIEPQHYDKFDGAIPSYNISPVLKNDKTIQAHRQLWSDILDKVYSKVL